MPRVFRFEAEGMVLQTDPDARRTMAKDRGQWRTLFRRMIVVVVN